MAYKVVFQTGPLAGKEFNLDFMPVRIGRSRDNIAHLPESCADVSGRHFAVKIVDGKVRLENVSSHEQPGPGGVRMAPGSMLDLAPGEIVRVGKDSSFVLVETPDGDDIPTGNVDAAGGERETHGTATGAGSPTCGTATGARTSAGSPTRGTAPGGTTNGTTTGGPTEYGISAGGGTYFLPQKIIEDEIEAAKRRRRRRFIRRMTILGAAFAAIAFAYFYARPSPEENITWPLRPDGKEDMCEVILPLPSGNELVGFQVPRDGRMQVSIDTNNFTCTIDTFAGRDRDVPVRLHFECDDSPENLVKDRAILFAEKCAKFEGKNWNFGASSPGAFLSLGRDGGGIAISEKQYMRSENTGRGLRQYFGYIVFAMQGGTAITFTREIPVAEQWRAGGFLARERMIAITRHFEDIHWEGRPDYRDKLPADMLAEVDELLSRNSPLFWSEAEFILGSVLVKCGGKGEYAVKALSKLESLRLLQRREFNRLYSRSKVVGEKAAMQEALMIFQSPSDRRNMLLKKGRWN